MNTQVMFSNKSDEWSTPQELFDALNDEFDFNLDPCATEENHKCEKFFTKENDGISQNWGGTECFVIHLIQKLVHGLLKRTTKEEKIIRLLYF